MRKVNDNGLVILYADENKILRSRITGNKFEFVYLSKNDSENNYIEESKQPEEIESTLVLVDKIRKSKLDDLEVRYKLIKDRINKASTREELLSIEIL